MFSVVEKMWMGIGVGVLVVSVLIYAIYISRQIKEYDDYQLASRDVGTWSMTLTLLGTAIGGATLLGYTTDSYLMGMERVWMIFPATLFAIPLMIIFLLTPISNIGKKFNMTSICDFTAKRYGEEARYPSAICTLIAYCGITGMQYIAVATFLTVVFGIPQGWGIFLGFIFIALKTYLGGLKVVIFSDVVYGICQTVGVVVVFIVMLVASGGFGQAHQNAIALGRPDFMIPIMSFKELMVFVLTIGAYQLVRQDRWQRIFSAKSHRINIVSNWAACGLSALTSFLVISVGSLAWAGIQMDIPNTSLAYYAIAHEILPLPLAVFVVTAVIATVISCGDSFLMAGSLTVMNDVVKPIFKDFKNLPEDQRQKKLVEWSRYSMALTAILALGLAYYMPNLILLWVMGTAMLTSGMVFPVLAAFFWRGATNISGVASIWGGLITAAFWELAGHPMGWHPVFVGIPVSIVLLIVVSQFTKPSDPKIVESMLRANNKIPLTDEELAKIEVGI